jgi:hypothetical protein
MINDYEIPPDVSRFFLNRSNTEIKIDYCPTLANGRDERSPYLARCRKVHT